MSQIPEATSIPPGSMEALPLEGPPRDPRDPGSRGMAIVAWITLVLLSLVVVISNQVELSQPPAPPETSGEVVAPGDTDMRVINAKVSVRLANALKSLSGGKLDPASAAIIVDSVRGAQEAPEDAFRTVIVSAELAGPEQGRQSLDKMTLDYPGAEEDAATMRRILEAGADALSQEERDWLVGRHGYFGRLALVQGLKDSDPQRAVLVSGGGAILAFFGVVFVVMGVVGIASLVCFVLMLMRIAQRKVRPAFVRPAPGGSVFLETTAVFVAAFLLLQIVMSLVVKQFGLEEESAGALRLRLLAQWLVMGVIFWALVRRTPWAELKRRIGWTSGRGVLREVGAGVFAYLAGLPLLVGAMVLTLVIVLVRQAIRTYMGEPIHTPKNPVLEVLTSGDAVVLVLMYLLATVWAPIVEESVFRGSFYRHLRSRVGVIAAAAISAFVFGAMHGYEFLMLMPVMTLGFIFALMREWRGSLIAPITAHALHNGTVLALVLVGLRVIVGD